MSGAGGLNPQNPPWYATDAPHPQGSIGYLSYNSRGKQPIDSSSYLCGNKFLYLNP